MREPTLIEDIDFFMFRPETAPFKDKLEFRRPAGRPKAEHAAGFQT